jgi:hypothetical protein
VSSQLVQASLAPASQAAYAKVIHSFDLFCSTNLLIHNAIPATPSSIMCYIAHLYQSGYAASSIHHIVSTISYYHNLYQLPDPSQSFLVKKMLSGIAKSLPSADLRTPITPTMLHSLVASCPFVSSSTYYSTLLAAMYLLAFHAFLRVGEFTVSHQNQINPNLLQYHQVSVQSSHILLTFHAFKHHRGPPITLSVRSIQPQGVCPVHHLVSYLNVRGPLPGPLFQFPSGLPITKGFFQQQLSLSLAWSNLPAISIRSHSFRIGAATAAAAAGCSDEAIQRMGRWKSSSFKRYIRIPSLSLHM